MFKYGKFIRLALSVASVVSSVMAYRQQKKNEQANTKYGSNKPYSSYWD